MKTILLNSLGVVSFIFVIGLQTALSQEETNSSQTVLESTSDDALQTLELNAGESQVINTDFDVTRIGVGSPDVIEATRTSPRQVLVNAVQDGRTNLLLWNGEQLQIEYDVIVGELRDANTLARDIRELLSGLEEVNIRVVGDQVVVEGEVYSQREYERVERIVSDMEGVINLVQTGEQFNRLLASEIEQTIGIEGVTVRYSRSGYILEGIVLSEAEMDYARSIAESFTDNVISALYIDPNAAEERPIAGGVQLDVMIVEVNKDSFADFSNDFTVSGNIDLSADAASGGDTAVGGLVISDENLRKLQDEGKGRVLLQHSLLGESGQPSDLFVGDEVPIPVDQGSGSVSIEYKPIGLSVKFLPSIYSDRSVTLQMTVGSSSITGEGLGGAPQLSNLEVSTVASVPNAQSVALTGLIKQRQLDSYFGSANRGFFSRFSNRSKDRSTGDGGGRRSFFESEASDDPNRFTNERREVLVIVRPSIINNKSRSIRDIRNAIERSFKDYELDRYKDLDTLDLNIYGVDTQ